MLYFSTVYLNSLILLLIENAIAQKIEMLENRKYFANIKARKKELLNYVINYFKNI